MNTKNAKKVFLPDRENHPNESLKPIPVKKNNGKKSALTNIEKSYFEPKVIFVNVLDGKVQEKKESFINNQEAEAVLDYYSAMIQTNKEYDSSTTLVMTSAFRTQA